MASASAARRETGIPACELTLEGLEQRTGASGAEGPFLGAKRLKKRKTSQSRSSRKRGTLILADFR